LSKGWDSVTREIEKRRKRRALKESRRERKRKAPT